MLPRDVTANETTDVRDADALYRQGMAFYRARQWREARDCFERLRLTEPDRRGVDSLIDELDHFIRLEEVRPAAAAAPETQRPAAGRSRQRAWLFVVPLLVALGLVAAVTAAGTGVFAPDVSPSPSTAVQATLLTARVAAPPVLLSAGGADDWQDWSNSRLLAERDRIRIAPQGVIEITLADGKVTLQGLDEVTLTVYRLSGNGEARFMQSSGDLRVQAGSRLFYLETPGLAAQCLDAGSIYRSQASTNVSRLIAERGQVLVTAGERSLVLTSGETAEATTGQPAAVQRPAPATPTAATGTPAVFTATATSTPTRSPTSSATPSTTPTTTGTATTPPSAPSPAATTPLLPPATPSSVPTLPPATRAPTDTPVPPTETPVPPTHTPAPPTPTRKR